MVSLWSLKIALAVQNFNKVVLLMRHGSVSPKSIVENNVLSCV